MNAFLIGRLQIEVNTFLSIAKQGLGRSPSKKLDQQGKSTEGTANWLAMLAELKSKDFNIEDPGHLLMHSFYIFQIVCDVDTLDEIHEQSGLCIHSVQAKNGLFIAIVSGRLDEWRTAVINSCSEQAGFGLRAIFDKILLLFESEGLGKLWSKYSKKTLSDQTFKLIERK